MSVSGIVDDISTLPNVPGPGASSSESREVPLPLLMLMGICAAWGALVLILATLANWQVRSHRALMMMADGLALFWIVIGGLLMYRFRDHARNLVRRLPIARPVTFVGFATVMALLEEAVTTTMTNLAPFFGVRVGDAYITASANYLDVVLGHSVIVFVPMFIAWAWLLSRYDFRPAEVFLLFGLTGTVAETGTFGPQNLAMAGFWIWVYGLMVWLPAYALSTRAAPRRPRPRPWHYPLAVVLPIACAIPMALIVMQLHPMSVHFPPIK
jgi:hypothetical protein